MRTLLKLLCVFPFLVACTGSAEKLTPPVLTSCDFATAYYKDQIGQPLDGPVIFTPHRVIKPGTAVTMDFNPGRLNVYTDAKGVVIDARCS